MKIVRIFADQLHLFAFCFEGEKMNELQRLLTLWNDTAYRIVTGKQIGRAHV